MAENAGTSVLNDTYEIDPGQPLPLFDNNSSKAFACSSRKGSEAELFALILDPRVPPRTDIFQIVMGLPSAGIIKCLDAGVINWRPSGRRQRVLVFEQPHGERVFADDEAQIEPLSDDRIIRGFLTPIIGILKEFAQRNITHRGVRPTNMFYSDTSARQMVLGDCLSTPPAFNQPEAFEPVESILADPAARGEGNISDDLYAVGVTTLSFLLGRMPARAEDPVDLIDSKIAKGSYGAVVGGARLQMNMVELLRGLLSDDVTERWSIRDVEAWIGGRRLTPKQAKLPQKAQRPLVIGGVENENIRSVSSGLTRNWLIAPEICKGQDFDNWLRRSLADDRIVENFNKIVGSSQEAFQNVDGHQLTAKCAIALDPAAPIRFKGFSAHVDGVGTALATYFFNDEKRQRIGDLILSKLVNNWMSLQPRSKPELLRIYSIIEKLPQHLNQVAPGFGIERCLYELQPEAHCLSPIIEHLFVYRMRAIVPALEAIARGERLPEEPIDRHIAAFIGARSNEVEESFIRRLTATDQTGTGAARGQLTLLAECQKKHKNGPAPRLAAWLADMMKPAISTFHNLKIRKEIDVAIEKAVETGILYELVNIYSDTKLVKRDQEGFVRARHEHHDCHQQIRRFRSDLENGDQFAEEVGEQVAAVISGVVGSIGATAIAVMNVF